MYVPKQQSNDTQLEIPANSTSNLPTVQASNNATTLHVYLHPNAQALDSPPLVGVDDNSWKISANTFKRQDLNAVKKKRKVRKFYEKQNEQVDEFLSLEQGTRTQEEIDASHAATKRQELLEKIALRVSYASNIVLFLIKVAASILSLSLSVITSAIDSSLDLLSGFILYITNYIRRRYGAVTWQMS